MSNLVIQRAMLKKVADALGPELLQEMTFVGGCTTGLLITDSFTQEQVRHTDDVDLIVHVMGTNGFHRLAQQLQCKGFKATLPEEGEDLPICALMLDQLRVDFMPDDENALGFSNRWYKAAQETATPYALDEQTQIRLVTPVYFLATKIEAYKGRGKDDPLESRDIEDLMNLVDGRPELTLEVYQAPDEVKAYLAEELKALMQHKDFGYVISSQGGGNSEREEWLYQQLEKIIQGKP